MKEIGGYIELDTYHLPMLHEDGIALNCGRNALAYLFRSKNIKRLKVPCFICDSVIGICIREDVAIDYYHIGFDFKPASGLLLEDDEWLYLVNYYGQLDNEEIEGYVSKYKRVIVDQAQAYFQSPIKGVDTLYTCRKWFGVADGAFLYTDRVLDDDFPRDESFGRMEFLLGRYERTASEFYDGYNVNNKFFAGEPIKRMSKLTVNLLHAVDYRVVEHQRKENFLYCNERLESLNYLKLHTASFMYPLMVSNGAILRKKLQAEKIYIPTLWPAVFRIAAAEDLEYKMAKNILPLPIDQRYKVDDMDYMINKIFELVEG